MKPHILILSAMLLVCMAGCGRESQVEALQHTDYALSDGSTNSRYIEFHMDSFLAVESFEISQPYHYRVGMNRDEVRRIFRQTQPMSSILRPPRGWRSMSRDEFGVAWPAYEFEFDHANTIVASCDVYYTGGGTHILFFDSIGKLVGFERMPDGLIYYGCLSFCSVAA